MAVKRWIVFAAAIGLLGALGALMWQVRVNRAQVERLAQITAENEKLRRQAADLKRQVASATTTSAPERAVEPDTNAPHSTRPAGNPDDAIAMQKLKLSLTDANSAIAHLQARLDEAEARIQNLSVDNKRLSSSEADLTQNLAAANQAVDVLQKELKSRNDRVTQVEIAYQRLRDQSGGDAQKIAQLQQLAAELQEIHQRREVYLNSILRRYKQITEQYRSMSGVLQAQRTDAPAAGSVDLARIQDSISMAEEDLRQLNSLNAQALRIQKKMLGK